MAGSAATEVTRDGAAFADRVATQEIVSQTLETNQQRTSTGKTPAPARKAKTFTEVVNNGGVAQPVIKGKPQNEPASAATSRQAVIVMTAKEGYDFIDTYKAVRNRTTADQHVMRAFRSGEHKMSLVLKPEADSEMLLAEVKRAIVGPECRGSPLAGE